MEDKDVFKEVIAFYLSLPLQGQIGVIILAIIVLWVLIRSGFIGMFFGGGDDDGPSFGGGSFSGGGASGKW